MTEEVNIELLLPADNESFKPVVEQVNCNYFVIYNYSQSTRKVIFKHYADSIG